MSSLLIVKDLKVNSVLLNKYIRGLCIARNSILIVDSADHYNIQPHFRLDYK